DWAECFRGARAALAEAFAVTHSLSLQQTLYAMGEAVLAACPEVAEVRLSLPNKHHFLVDLDPFGLDNPGVGFYAADRPDGLIEGTVGRAGAPGGGPEPQWGGPPRRPRAARAAGGGPNAASARAGASRGGGSAGPGGKPPDPRASRSQRSAREGGND